MVSSQDVEPCVLAARLLDRLARGVDTLGLSVVRSTINNHRPVHQLPVEVLGIIFRYALPSNDGGFRQSGAKEPDMHEERRERVAITHVCRRWRAAASEMAAFWTLIDASSVQWATTCFERSGTMPLHVFLRYPLDSTTETPLASEGARIRDLFIEFPKDRRSIIPTELPTFLPEVPNMESLSIVTRSKAFEEGRPMVDLSQCPPLFPQPPPRLRTLILKNQCWFPTIPYEQLTHLHIAQCTPVDLRALVGLLGRCTALEALVLADVYLASARAVPDDCTAPLPRLRLLALGIHQSRLSMRRMLKCLVLPATGIIVRISGNEAARALCDLQPFPALPFAADFDTLTLDRTADGLVLQAACARTGTGLLLELNHSYASLLGSLAKNVLPALIPFANITRLTVRADKCDAALHLLPAMPSVAAVCVVDAAPQGIDAGAAIGAALVEFPQCVPRVSELAIWSPRRELNCLPKLPFIPIKLKKLSFCHMRSAGPDAPAGPPPGREYLESAIAEVDFRTVDVADVPNLIDLPGVQPLNHIYDW
ncbi:hypothetical protein TRAPUB_8509 [Trametes pubescens]|uniref:Uncharacterized protein n=1 Tax=Trametes pubescens TaxID=154538 RepID=A0A1M2W505_TRAPU|nr:hypothetical protein TRAPUB_8509 [Trametes pubescens]